MQGRQVKTNKDNERSKGLIVTPRGGQAIIKGQEKKDKNEKGRLPKWRKLKVNWTMGNNQRTGKTGRNLEEEEN